MEIKEIFKEKRKTVATAKWLVFMGAATK